MFGHTGGNKREAAERLGISYKAILYKIREFGVGRPRQPRKPPVAPVATAPENIVAPPPETWAAEIDTEAEAEGSPSLDMMGARSDSARPSLRYDGRALRQCSPVAPI